MKKTAKTTAADSKEIKVGQTLYLLTIEDNIDSDNNEEEIFTTPEGAVEYAKGKLEDYYKTKKGLLIDEDHLNRKKNNLAKDLLNSRGYYQEDDTAIDDDGDEQAVDVEFYLEKRKLRK